MSEQWHETCGCGATIKLIGWLHSSSSKAAEKWRKEHRCKNPYNEGSDHVA